MSRKRDTLSPSHPLTLNPAVHLKPVRQILGAAAGYLAALAWEEFLLALPMKPLCDPACKGLCPQCGVNRNTATCSCGTDAADPRMAPLRGLKVKR